MRLFRYREEDVTQSLECLWHVIWLVPGKAADFIMLPYCSRRLLKSLKFVIALTMLFSVTLIYKVSFRPDIAVKRYPPQQLPRYECPCNTSSVPNRESPYANQNLTEHRALILLESAYSRHGRLLQQILTASKYPFKAETFSKNLPLLTTATRGRYAIIIIENYYKYLNMARWNRQLLDKYCVDYNVPLISFLSTRPNTTYQKVKIKGSKLHFWQNQEVLSLKVAESDIHRISRIGNERTDVNTQEWILFEESPAVSTVISARDSFGRPRAAVVHDRGEEDNVKRILFGHNVTDWTIKMTFLDVLWYTTGGRVGWSLDRYVQIDVDDIFVGARGTRMNMRLPVKYPYAIAPQHDGVYPVHSELYKAWKKVSIFMTHQQNFAHDRLALYTFDNLVRFIQCWTNIRLLWQSPVESAKKYFSLMPQERLPVWSNPCNDPRHKAILPPSLNCSNLTLPNTLIVGPQKTGSTALATFLSLHPNVSTNAPIPDSFEELQFFGGANYHNGIEWYTRQFTRAHVVYDKSATYFDNANAARDAFALVPDAKIVVILYDPARRAYSWYQHILAHNDSVAVAAGSMDVILNAETPQLRKIKQRCISGGRYTHHLDRWLEHYPMSNLILVDGERLREEPAIVMTELTEKLGLPYFDYSKAVRYSSSKRFFCQVIDGKTKCLGRGKGRVYPPMPPELWARLNNIFLQDNTALHKFLVKNHLPVPKWLRSLLEG
ncbi:sulfotransferase domain protein [Ancylostoma duodenale]|uniref:[heparan sulfate]-glucosamine N-sulfotransferase n=1 Tax=Ancylostoma duodenale TaxID=51022 RepID=A0A0C2D2F1_9BILA|nr:sulfotransferase domain protein [Ancylostoma duodenale]